MTIAGRDSSAFLPDDAGLAQAFRDGIRFWAGYFAGPGIWVGWPDSNFLRIKAAGMESLAFCSGGSDPVACRARADRLGILFGTDTEANIPDGGQAWLDASGTGGAYGGAAVMARRAAWHIVADYRNLPGDTWPSYLARPAGPLGWQFQGTHSEYGGSVDSSRLDDWFGGTQPQGEDLTPEENAALARIDSAVPGIAAAVQWVINDPASGVVALKAELAKIDAATQWAINDPTSGLAALKKELDALKGQISSLPAGSAPAGGTITGTITGTIKP